MDYQKYVLKTWGYLAGISSHTFCESVALMEVSPVPANEIISVPIVETLPHWYEFFVRVFS
jgi:hypothetical protein